MMEATVLRVSQSSSYLPNNLGACLSAHWLYPVELWPLMTIWFTHILWTKSLQNGWGQLRWGRPYPNSWSLYEQREICDLGGRDRNAPRTHGAPRAFSTSLAGSRKRGYFPRSPGRDRALWRADFRHAISRTPWKNIFVGLSHLDRGNSCGSPRKLIGWWTNNCKVLMGIKRKFLERIFHVCF